MDELFKKPIKLAVKLHTANKKCLNSNFGLAKRIVRIM